MICMYRTNALLQSAITNDYKVLPLKNSPTHSWLAILWGRGVRSWLGSASRRWRRLRRQRPSRRSLGRRGTTTWQIRITTRECTNAYAVNVKKKNNYRRNFLKFALLV
jgi:hypothetical protein